MQGKNNMIGETAIGILCREQDANCLDNNISILLYCLRTIGLRCVPETGSVRVAIFLFVFNNY